LSDSTLLKDVVLLGLGLGGGFAIASYFHGKQKTASDNSESNLVAILDRNYEQALRNGVRDTVVMNSICTIENEVASLSDLVDIKEKIEEVVSRLGKITANGEPPIDLVLRYKALGDRWSELVSVQLDLRLFDNDGVINKERLKSVHKGIFPDNYPWAGMYRKEHVHVVDHYGTTARIVDWASAESTVSTISPDKIEDNLERLFLHWNENIVGLAKRNADVKIEEVAHFHHEFEIIHPFLDGNGRIGRMLLEEQLKLLFQKKIVFRPDRDDYYRALRMLNMGDSAALSGLIRNELKRFNVDFSG